MSENFRKNNIAQSVFEKNFNQISDSKKEILSQKYNCSICLEIIKHENPFLCYECQKIFHHSCLNYWNDRQKHLNKILSCPNCRNELPLEKWKVFRNYDETRTKDAQILNQLGKSFNSNEYIDKATNLFKLILNKLNIIHPKINSQKNYKLNNLIEEFKYNLIDPSIDEISTVIIEELDLLEEYITKMKEDIQKNKYKNEINLKYLTEKGGTRQIFECDFVQRNINNISLIINGYKLPIVEEYNLKAGENDVTICFKNTLTDLSNMFYFSEDLYNIDELKYLNTENVTDFTNMFRNCKKLSNIKALENWDTSKAETFQGMFDGCELITNIKPLKNWNVSSCKNFSGMFCSCNISEIAPLENWKVSNGKFFDRFLSCNLITDISPLRMFISCGSSSIPDERRNFPTLVTLGSSFILNTGPSISFFSCNDSSLLSASQHMVLNLYILKYFPFFPHRICEKIGLPLLSSIRITIATITKNGNNTTRVAKDETISNNLFTTS